MLSQAKNNRVEVAAWELKKGNEEARYFVLPWKGNTGRYSNSHIEEVGLYVLGYTKDDVTGMIHTHPWSTEPSQGDKDFTDFYNIPIYTIGANGTYYVYSNGQTKPYLPK